MCIRDSCHHSALAARGASWEQVADTVEEVAPVPEGLEADQIVGEEGEQHLGAPGQTQEYVERREGNVKEEPQGCGDTHLAEFTADAHQVVVVYPDVLALGAAIGHDRGEALVGPLVGVPGFGGEVTP